MASSNGYNNQPYHNPDTTPWQQDPNAHYQTPPGYVLVPISQLGHLQPPPSQQPLQPSPQESSNYASSPPPQLPPRPPSSHAQNVLQTIPSAPMPHNSHHAVGNTLAPFASTQFPTFPTQTPFVLNVHYIDDNKDLFLPPSASPTDPVGYEAVYRKLDYSDRKNPHVKVYQRFLDAHGNLQTRLAGSCIYHHYWSNNLTMSMPFLSEPWEFAESWLSDVGTCEGRALEFSLGDKGDQQFLLELKETNGKPVCCVGMDTLRTGSIHVHVPLENQQQMDEMIAVVVSFMQRYRIKLVKDSKSLLKDEDWEALNKFSTTANTALGFDGA